MRRGRGARCHWGGGAAELVDPADVVPGAVAADDEGAGGGGEGGAHLRLEVLTKRPVVAGDAEVRRNARSRSAKLRVARVLSPDEVVRGKVNKYRP